MCLCVFVFLGSGFLNLLLTTGSRAKGMVMSHMQPLYAPNFAFLCQFISPSPFLTPSSLSSSSSSSHHFLLPLSHSLHSFPQTLHPPFPTLPPSPSVCSSICIIWADGIHQEWGYNPYSRCCSHHISKQTQDFTHP